MKPEEIISDEEIDRIHGNANFRGMDKREVVNIGVLKCASGYFQGEKTMQIITAHKLIDDGYKLTEKGRSYLWWVFGNGKF